MKYLTILCACSILHSGEGVPVLIPEEANVLSELVSRSTEYLGGLQLLSQKQTLALKHFMEESSKSETGASALSEQAATLLHIMEVVSERSGPISKEEVATLRGIELKSHGWTPQEIIRLEKGQDVELLKKYVERAKLQGNLNGFMLGQRSKLLRSVAEKIGNGFTQEDISVLRQIELKASGLDDRDILRLKTLAKKRNSEDVLSEEEISSLRKWIQVETLANGSDAMSFEESASLYELVQNQPDPPLSPRELKINKLAFQRKVETGISMPMETLNILLQTAGNVSAYIGESQLLTPEQVKACQVFVEATLEFGGIYGIGPVEAGELLQLLELRPEFQQLMYPMQSVFYVELVKNGMRETQRKGLSALREKMRHQESLALSKSETALLKEYVASAKKPGGLNGFTVQERTSFFSLVQKHVSQGFTVSDVEVLRAREQRMNGFSAEEVYRFKVLRKGKQKEVSLEEECLLKRFEQVERILGEGTLFQRP